MGSKSWTDLSWDGFSSYNESDDNNEGDEENVGQSDSKGQSDVSIIFFAKYD